MSDNDQIEMRPTSSTNRQGHRVFRVEAIMAGQVVGYAEIEFDNSEIASLERICVNKDKRRHAQKQSGGNLRIADDLLKRVLEEAKLRKCSQVRSHPSAHECDAQGNILSRAVGDQGRLEKWYKDRGFFKSDFDEGEGDDDVVALYWVKDI